MDQKKTLKKFHFLWGMVVVTMLCRSVQHRECDKLAKMNWTAAIRSIYNALDGLLNTGHHNAGLHVYRECDLAQFSGQKKVCQNDCSRYHLDGQSQRTEPEICGLLVIWHGQSGRHNGSYWRRNQINRKRLIDG